jgi:uncharacterized membrane protein
MYHVILVGQDPDIRMPVDKAIKPMKAIKVTLWFLLLLSLGLPAWLLVIADARETGPSGIVTVTCLGLLLIIGSAGKTLIFEHPWKKHQ